jgi:hypothetical protein
VLGDGELPEELVVFGVSSDPKPRDAILDLDTEGAIATANPN